MKPESQKMQKAYEISKCATVNTEYDVKKQHIQSEMRVIRICHVRQSVIRLIKLLKQREKCSDTMCCRGPKQSRVASIHEMKQGGFGWHKKLSSIATQTVPALLCSLFARKYFPLGYNRTNVLFFRNLNHVARKIFLLWK